MRLVSWRIGTVLALATVLAACGGPEWKRIIAKHGDEASKSRSRKLLNRMNRL